MRQCEKAIIAAGFKNVRIVATLPGEKLYERFGYQVSRRFDIALNNGLNLPAVEMFKMIG